MTTSTNAFGHKAFTVLFVFLLFNTYSSTSFAQGKKTMFTLDASSDYQIIYEWSELKQTVSGANINKLHFYAGYGSHNGCFDSGKDKAVNTINGPSETGTWEYEVGPGVTQNYAIRYEQARQNRFLWATWWNPHNWSWGPCLTATTADIKNPLNVNAAYNKNNNSISLSWEKGSDIPDDLLQYKIFRLDGQSQSETEIATVSGKTLSYTDLYKAAEVSFNINEEYRYIVRTYSNTADWGEHISSGSYSSRVQTYQLYPTDKLISEDYVDAQIKLTWNAVSNADGYRIYVSGEIFGTTEGSDTTFIDHQPQGDNINICITSTYSKFNFESDAYCSNESPLYFEATDSIYDGKIELTWTVAPHMRTGYRIYRENELIAEIQDPDITSYTDINVDTNNEYEYKITAYNFNDEIESASVSDHGSTSPRKSIEYFEASKNAYYKKIKLVWGHNSSLANGYNIYRDNNLITSIDDISSSEYLDEDITPGETYTYNIALKFPDDNETARMSSEGSTLKTTFNASDNASDAYIGFNWELDANCLTGLNGENVYLQIKDADGNEIFNKNIEDADNHLTPNRYSFNKTLYFDGEADWISLETAELSMPTSEWTAEFWVNKKESAQTSILLSDEQNCIYLQDDDFEQRVTINNSFVFDTIIAPNKWTHLAFVASASKTSLYVNGKLADVVNTNIVCPLQAIGGHVNNTNGSLNGKLGEVRIWSTARTQKEIAYNMYHVFDGNETGLFANWQFTEGTGLKVTDVVQGKTAYLNHCKWVDFMPETYKNETIADSYLYFAGDDYASDFTLNIYTIGDGTKTCTPLEDSGSTRAFQTPVLSATDSYAHKVELNWDRETDIATHYRIHRMGENDTMVIAVLDSMQSTFSDEYAFYDNSSLENGAVYNYGLEVFNDIEDQSYDTIYAMGSTVKAEMLASDDLYKDAVKLSWNNMSGWADTITVTRDNTTMATLKGNDTTFMDTVPVYGKKHLYGIVLFKGGERLVAISDTGSIAPNGFISGRVTTLTGDYGVPGATVTMTAVVENENIELTTKTDPTGYYEFVDVYYNRESKFYLEVEKKGHKFSTGKLDVTLNTDQHIQQHIDFKDKYKYNTKGKETLELNNFAVNPNVQEDFIELNWDFSSSANALFKIHRNNKLLTILDNKDSFIDTEGIPGEKYKYTVSLYSLVEDEITELASNDSVYFPVLAPVNVDNILVSPDDDSGIVTLSWSHTSENMDGFYLYRNDSLFKTILSYEDFRAIDYKGYPGKEHIYGIQTFVNKDNSLYKSAVTLCDAITYPDMPQASIIEADVDTIPDEVMVSWEHAIPGQYNYNGFKIYRDDTLLIRTVHKAFPSMILDKDAIPGNTYMYGVKTYLQSNDSITETSGITSQPVTIPALTPPVNLAANNNNKPGYITLNWEYLANNNSGFSIYLDDDSLTSVEKGTLNFNHFINDDYDNNSSFNYMVKSYKNIDDAIVYSNGAVISGQAYEDNAGDFPPPVDNFTASSQFGNHVHLNWDYVDYILPEFELLRNDELLTVIEASNQRDYYDTTAMQGIEYIYQIRARYQSDESKVRSALGKIGSRSVISGMVTNNINGNGVNNALVTAKSTLSNGNICQRSAYTDVSGFYRINNITDIHGSIYNVHVEAQNYAFVQNQVNIVVDSIQSGYTVNFTAENSYDKFSASGFAIPVNLSAQANAQNYTVEVRWNPSSDKYTGFEVFRNFVPIGTVYKGDELKVVDTTGVPGYSYAYRIKSFYETNTSRKESETMGIEAQFPPIAPVENIKATANSNKDIVSVSWDHFSHYHDYYEITRNDSVLGTVETQNASIFNDSTGIPLQLYNYGVTACKVINSTVYKSNIRTTKQTFPALTKVTKLTAEAQDTANQVHLEWANASDNVLGYNIYRNGSLIKTEENKDTYFYDDYGSIPETRQEYEVTTFAVRDSLVYESAPTSVIIESPQLLTPMNLTALANSVNETVELEWEYPATGAHGFNIYRDGVLLEEISDINIKSYTDNEGIPDHAYEYSVTAYAVRDKKVYESYAGTKTVTFPEMNPPSLTYASDDKRGRIEIEWEYNSENNDGFEIRGYKLYEVYTDSMFKVIPNKGIRKFSWVFYEYYNQYVLSIRSFKVINNIVYYSKYSNDKSANFLNNSYYSQEKLNILKATDGDYKDKVKITWNHSYIPDQVYKLYKDDNLIAEVDLNKTFYIDEDVIPGKIYTYALDIIQEGGLSHYYMDEGHARLNGKIQGSVVTQLGLYGVPGKEVNAIDTIDGNIYRYTAVTDAEGNYIMNDVYYGEEADYKIMVGNENESNDYDDNEHDVTLNNNMPTGYVADFLYKKAYMLQGYIRHKNITDCGLDSMLVVLKTQNIDGEEPTQETTRTDDTGFFSFNIRPFDPQLEYFVLKADTMRVTGVQSPTPDTAYFKFEVDSVVFAKDDFDENTAVTRQDFEETSTYPIDIIVKNTCGKIGDHKFMINIKSVNGCYETIDTLTDIDGKLTIDLPPLQYMVKVTGVETESPDIIPIVDYLRVRPKFYDLEDIHNIVSNSNTPVDSIQNELELQLVYHKTPEIRIEGIDNYLCNNPQLPSCIEQEKTYTLDIQVFETHEQECSVTEGYLLIKNQASDNSAEIRIDYDKTTGRFPDYAFRAGEPNIINPYYHNLVIEYHTQSDGFLAEYIQPYIVEGIKSPPGSDVMVEPEKNNNNLVQLPLFILRDPPGDKSYSYIEKGTTVTSEIKTNFTGGGYGGGYLDLKALILGYGTHITSELISGYTGSNEKVLEVTTSISETIQTSDEALVNSKGEYLVGRLADIIVGSGVALKYGIGRRLWIEENCRIGLKSEITVSLSEILTTWVYTVNHIENLIAGYEIQLEQLKEGSLVIQGKTEDDITALKESWESILQYHDETTLPHYCLCDTKMLKKTLYSEDDKDSIYNKWYDYANSFDKIEFCNEIGSYDSNNNFKLKDHVEWTSDLMDKYNTFALEANTAINAFNDSRRNVFTGWETSTYIEEYKQMYYDKFGPDASNYTFTGATSYQNEVQNAQSFSTSISHQSYLKGDFSVGFAMDKEFKTIFGSSLGAILAKDESLLKVELDAGIKFGFNFEWTKSYTDTEEKTTKIGYVLSDDDPGDQYSVAVIKGVATNHTPYFALVGGRTSCPTEDGAIPRDIPQISLEYPNGNGVNNAQYDLDPENNALFPVKLSSLNPFFETRDYTLKVAPGSNPYNATIKNAGKTMGEMTYSIEPMGSVYTNISIEKGPDHYQFENIELTLEAACESTDSDSKTVSVYFESPCSDVSIIEPGENWVLHKEVENKQEYLIVSFSDYDLDNTKFKGITLQYRRAGNDGWSPMESFTKDSLITYYKEFKSVYTRPTYKYLWELTGNEEIVDGQYEIRAVLNCGKDGEIFSNVTSGTIDRTSINLFGEPEPKDGILSLGDEISVQFNEYIDCPFFNDTCYSFIKASDSTEIQTTYSCKDDKLVFMIEQSVLNALEDETIIGSVFEAVDLNGNHLEDTLSWSFKVSNNPAYWYPDSLSLDIYKGTTVTTTKTLFNAGSENLAFNISNIPDWCTLSVTSGNVPPNGVAIDFEFDAGNLEVSEYEQVLNITIDGFSDLSLPVKINVLQPQPNWDVQEEYYSYSMNAIANFDIDSIGLSTDTMDIIAVLIDNEFRGLSHIQKVGDDFYNAYLTIWGNSSDEGKELEFRIWDASLGYDYDGDAGFDVLFESNKVYGSTADPLVLNVISGKDRGRYIPLIAGWNWISINTEQEDMSVSNVLRNLNASQDDVLKTMDKSCSYIDGSGWYSINGFDQIAPEDGYLLYIGQADTMRLTGTNASVTPFDLNKGWNLIGYPLQQSMDINDVVKLTNVSDGDIIKSSDGFAEYTQSAWTGSLSTLVPYKSYMIRLSEGSSMEYNSNAGLKAGNSVNWSMNPSDFEHNLIVTGKLLNMNNNDITGNKIVAAFVNNECRGIGSLQMVEPLDEYQVSMFVYSNTAQDEWVKFQVLDVDNDSIYQVNDSIPFVSNATMGSFTNPYILELNIGCPDIPIGKINGMQVVEANSKLTYSVTESDSDSKYYWDVTHGTLVSDPHKNFVEILWSSGYESGHLSVAMENENGCMSDTAQLYVTISEADFEEENNFFSPNGDGINDTWQVKDINAYSNCELFIYNSMGELVFHTNEYHNNWDGTYKNKRLPDGTYYYMFKCDNNAIKTGTVSLLK